MMTNPLFSCKFFEYFESVENLDLEKDITVSISQPELVLDGSLSIQEILPHFHQFNERPKIPFNRKNVDYTVTYKNLQSINIHKPAALIPARDSLELLEFTLSNLNKYKVLDHVLPVLIDDRSKNSNEMKSLADKYNTLYVRVDYNSSTFNFSVINNAAAAFCHKVGFEDIILWNSDLWVDSEDVVPYLLEQHRNHKEDDVWATGVKLLYPTKGFCDLMDDDKFITSLAKDFNTTEQRILDYKPFGSVQFGGSTYVTTPFFQGHTPIVNSPIHFGRFSDKDSLDLNTNRQVHFMTGAFILCDTEKFKEIGALNPSMNSQFQDVDFCLRLNKSGYKIMFYGKDVHMLHAESMSLSSKGSTDEGMKSTMDFNVDMLSNQVLYATIWNKAFSMGELRI